MTNRDTIELAREMERMRNRLDELWLRPENAGRRPEIELQRRRLSDEIIRLISVHVRAHGDEYDAATSALRRANDDLKTALSDAERADRAIDAASRAIDLIGLVMTVAA